MQRNSTVLIIGGGIIGLSLAWELARRSQNVRVLESDPKRHPPSSWAGAGILPPAPRHGAIDPYEQLKTLSRTLHEQWAEQLSADTGIDTGFRKCGGIYLASSRAEAATLAANKYWWDLHGIASQQLDVNELCLLEPQLTDFAQHRLISAWLLPDECQVRNPRYLKALRSACQSRGVVFLQETVCEIDSESKVHTENGNRYDAEKICLCSGAWTRLMLEQLGFVSGIMPVRGQIVLYRPANRIIGRVINEGHRYLVPRDDGLILAGSVEEEVGYISQTTEEGLCSIRQWAETILPTLRQAPIEKSWAGLRPGSYDNLPYLGAIPGSDKLFVAAGHYRSGLQLASATAVVMANLILDQPNEIDLRPFRIGRG